MGIKTILALLTFALAVCPLLNPVLADPPPPPLTGYISTDRQTYSIGDTIYIHFGLSLPGAAPGQLPVAIMEVLFDGTSTVVFNQFININQDYETSATASGPTGVRTLILCNMSTKKCSQLATTSFLVILQPLQVPIMIAAAGIVVLVGAATLLTIRRRRRSPRSRKEAVVPIVPSHAETKLCISCKAELPPDAKFCDSCGSQQT